VAFNVIGHGSAAQMTGLVINVEGVPHSLLSSLDKKEDWLTAGLSSSTFVYIGNSS